MSRVHVCGYGERLVHQADEAVGLCPRHIIYIREAFLQQEYILYNFRSSADQFFPKFKFYISLLST